MYEHRYRKGKFAETWHRDQKILPDHERGVHATDLLARESVRIIKSAKDKPFFLYVPFQSVHTPLDERGRFVDRPTQLDPDKPGRWLDEDEIEWFHDPKGIIQSEKDPEKRLFLAAVHHLDDAVRRIVQALDKRGLRENTILVFTSDNGPQVNWGGKAYPDDLRLTDFNQKLPFRGKKVDVWEGGIHVPAFVSWPAQKLGGRYERAMHIADWFPSFASLLGHEVEEDPAWNGMNLCEQLFDRGSSTPPVERAIYWSWGKPNRWALRRGDWKIVRYGGKEARDASDWKLFNLEADPKETSDVGAEHPEILAALHAAFVAERRRDPKPARRR